MLPLADSIKHSYTDMRFLQSWASDCEKVSVETNSRVIKMFNRLIAEIYSKKSAKPFSQPNAQDCNKENNLRIPK